MQQRAVIHRATEPTVLADDHSQGGNRPTRERVARGRSSGDSSASATVGRFKLHERIGIGGMGEIYAAYDESIQQKVAIKLVRTDLKTGPEAEARLFREAQTLARVNHPNVVKIVEAARVDGRTFIAMEFVPGVTLNQWLEERRASGRPASVDEILNVFISAGRGLAATHRAGLVHRDFKPGNVLIDDEGHVRVVDFGLARPVDPDELVVEPIVETVMEPMVEMGVEAVDSSTARATAGTEAGQPGDMRPPAYLPLLTRGSQCLGTPYYMSPEQMRREPTDHRSDQFNFCVALYHALYSACPFRGSDRLEHREAVQNGDRAPCPRVRGIPAVVRRALERGLAADPDRRFADMGQLLAELHRARQRSTQRSTRWHWGIGGALLAVCGIFLAWLLAGSPPVPAAGGDHRPMAISRDICPQPPGSPRVTPGQSREPGH